MEESKFSKSADDLLESEEFWPHLSLASTSVVEGELEKLKRFRQFLRPEDNEIFDDLLNQCRVYALLDIPVFVTTARWKCRECPKQVNGGPNSHLFGDMSKHWEIAHPFQLSVLKAIWSLGKTLESRGILCSYCGAEIPLDSRFCHLCGSDVGSDPQGQEEIVRESSRYILIENVVATADLNPKKTPYTYFILDLDHIARAFPGVEYHPEQFPGLVFRLDRPKTATLILGSGKMTATGANS